MGGPDFATYTPVQLLAFGHEIGETAWRLVEAPNVVDLKRSVDLLFALAIGAIENRDYALGAEHSELEVLSKSLAAVDDGSVKLDLPSILHSPLTGVSQELKRYLEATNPDDQRSLLGSVKGAAGVFQNACAQCRDVDLPATSLNFSFALPSS